MNKYIQVMRHIKNLHTVLNCTVVILCQVILAFEASIEVLEEKVFKNVVVILYFIYFYIFSNGLCFAFVLAKGKLDFH